MTKSIKKVFSISKSSFETYKRYNGFFFSNLEDNNGKNGATMP